MVELKASETQQGSKVEGLNEVGPLSLEEQCPKEHMTDV